MGLFRWHCQCCDLEFTANDIDWDESEVETCDIEVAICPKCYVTCAGKKIIKLHNENIDYERRLRDLKNLIIQNIEDNTPNSESLLYCAASDVFDKLDSRPDGVYKYRILVNAKWKVICSAFHLFNKYKYSTPKLDGLREDLVELKELLGWDSELVTKENITL